MSQKKYILLIDTEGTKEGFCYDVGTVVIDLHGNTIEYYSSLVIDTFFTKPQQIATTYYQDKLPQYGEKLANGKITFKTIEQIQEDLNNLINKYSIKNIAAYNVSYDIRTLNKTIQDANNKIQNFFPKNITMWCIWGMACETILNTNKYRTTAIKNNWTSSAGNIKTSAECAYRYITNDYDFIESHTALEDCFIESQIFWQTLKAHKKMSRTVIPQPWKLIQK